MESLKEELSFQLTHLLFYASLAAIAWLIWLLSRWKNRRDASLPRNRPDIRYCAYATEFDTVAIAAEVPGLLADLPRADLPPAGTKTVDWQQRVDLARQQYEQAGQGAARKIFRHALPADGRRFALTILIDQSGSAVNDLIGIAADLLMVVEECESAGVDIAILGYTTLGWQGGRSRRSWIEAGRPEYPGRLCDLLHVVYKQFHTPMPPEAWRQLLNARMCRENVDGEALLWAATVLRESTRPDRMLILVADGAPVDDSTFATNGDAFLWRHFAQVVEELQAADDMSFALVSRHEAPAFVSRHATYAAPEEFSATLAAVIDGRSSAPEEHLLH